MIKDGDGDKPLSVDVATLSFRASTVDGKEVWRIEHTPVLVNHQLLPTGMKEALLMMKAGPLTFSEDDIKELPAIIDQWRGPSNAVSAFLWQSLSSQDQIVLTNYRRSASSSNQAQAVVVQALNRIIGGPSVYESTRFQGISLRTETTDLLKEGTTGPTWPSSTACFSKTLIHWNCRGT